MEPTAVRPETLGYAEARARVLAAVTPLAIEEAALENAVGRALRADRKTPHDLPPFRNASMDGVAVRSRDLAGASRANPVRLRVGGEIPAGRPASRPLESGECMWIMTGAPLPDEADAVIAIEELEPGVGPAGDRGAPIAIAAPPTAGLNVRDAGADLRAGETLLERGRELSAHDIALAAAAGFATLPVGRRPRVAVISTGDELMEAGEPLRPGAIRDSNRPLLGALLPGAGAEVASMTHVGDDPDAVAAEIARALEHADVVITIGGVSAGAHDPVKAGIGRFADIALWRVAMKPGRPQAFGAPRGRLFFGLPGNPASVACVFEALVRPALRKLQGFEGLDRPRVPVRTGQVIESRAGRTDFVRVRLTRGPDGLMAHEAGAQVSGHLAPQSRAHALLIVPEEAPRLEAGDQASALLLRWPEP